MYKSGDTVTLDELQELEDQVRSQKTTKVVKKGELEPNKVVFIDPSSNLSREKFKKCYPTNKITYTLSKADVIITNDNYGYGQVFSYSYLNNMFRDDSNLVIPRWNRANLSQIVINDKQAVELNAALKKVDMYLSSLPLLHDMSLEMKGPIGRVVEKEEIDRISTMICSTDPEMVKLGLTMLMAFNYEDNKDAYILCLVKMRRTDMLRGRLYNDIRHKLNREFPNIRL